MGLSLQLLIVQYRPTLLCKGLINCGSTLLTTIHFILFFFSNGFLVMVSVSSYVSSQHYSFVLLPSCDLLKWVTPRELNFHDSWTLQSYINPKSVYWNLFNNLLTGWNHILPIRYWLWVGIHYVIWNKSNLVIVVTLFDFVYLTYVMFLHL